MDAERILKVTCRSGKILLKSGAEIYRVEETIVRILSALETDEAESFVTPSGIFISFEYLGVTHTKIIRNTSSTLNLYRINTINQASRDLCSKIITIEEFENIIKECEHSNENSIIKDCLISGTIASSFTLFYNGNLSDTFFAFFIGYIVKIASTYFNNRKINTFISIGMCSMLIVFMSHIFLQMHLIVNVDSVIIGTAMLLVPGIAITNAIRDSIAGDFLSGMTKTVEAIMIAVALALGTGAAMSIILFLKGGISI